MNLEMQQNSFYNIGWEPSINHPNEIENVSEVLYDFATHIVEHISTGMLKRQNTNTIVDALPDMIDPDSIDQMIRLATMMLKNDE